MVSIPCLEEIKGLVVPKKCLAPSVKQKMIEAKKEPIFDLNGQTV